MFSAVPLTSRPTHSKKNVFTNKLSTTDVMSMQVSWQLMWKLWTIPFTLCLGLDEISVVTLL